MSHFSDKYLKDMSYLTDMYCSGKDIYIVDSATVIDYFTQADKMYRQNKLNFALCYLNDIICMKSDARKIPVTMKQFGIECSAFDGALWQRSHIFESFKMMENARKDLNEIMSSTRYPEMATVVIARLAKIIDAKDSIGDSKEDSTNSNKRIKLESTDVKTDNKMGVIHGTAAVLNVAEEEKKKLVEENKKLSEENKKLVEENKKMVEEKKKLSEENKKMVEENKKHQESHKQLLEENQKLLVHQTHNNEVHNQLKENGRKAAVIQTTIARFQLDLETCLYKIGSEYKEHLKTISSDMYLLRDAVFDREHLHEEIQLLQERILKKEKDETDVKTDKTDVKSKTTVSNAPDISQEILKENNKKENESVQSQNQQNENEKENENENEKEKEKDDNVTISDSNNNNNNNNNNKTASTSTSNESDGDSDYEIVTK